MNKNQKIEELKSSAFMTLVMQVIFLLTLVIMGALTMIDVIHFKYWIGIVFICTGTYIFGVGILVCAITLFKANKDKVDIKWYKTVKTLLWCTINRSLILMLAKIDKAATSDN